LATSLSHIFRGVIVIDGSGAPPFRADVGIGSGIVAAVAPRIDRLADEVVDADGLVLAPGFIDIHGHSDLSLFRYPGAESKLFQGVTLEVCGNCGLSAFPVLPGRETELSGYLAVHEYSLPPGPIPWTDLSSYVAHMEALRPGINLALLVGHAALRIGAMGLDDRTASPSELAHMQQQLASALDQGAWGMSTGLIYPPGSYAGRDELVSLATTVALHGGLCTSHIRGEGDGLMEALDEAVEIALSAGVRMQVSHLKALGRNNRGKGSDALDRLATARQRGADIGADQYPYAASATSLTAVVPQWAHAGGVRALLNRLADPLLKERLVAEITVEMEKREGAAGIMISSCRSEGNRKFAGRTIEALAAAWECPAGEAVIRLLAEERAEVPAVFFSMAEEDVRAILADPTIAVGSDGHGLNAAEAVGDATHPRSYGCFPRVLGRYVREQGVLDLPAAIHKMTGLPASRLGIADRGFVREGNVADLVLFDPSVIADRADYADPHRYSTGISHLLIAGKPVIRDGSLTGIRAGRVVRRGR